MRWRDSSTSCCKDEQRLAVDDNLPVNVAAHSGKVQCLVACNFIQKISLRLYAIYYYYSVYCSIHVVRLLLGDVACLIRVSASSRSGGADCGRWKVRMPIGHCLAGPTSIVVRGLPTLSILALTCATLPPSVFFSLFFAGCAGNVVDSE